MFQTFFFAVGLQSWRLFLVLPILLVFGSWWGHAGENSRRGPVKNSFCERFFLKGPEDVGAKDFLGSRHIAVPSVGDYRYRGGNFCNVSVRNQKAIGSCWAHVGSVFLELRARRRGAPHMVPSVDYWVLTSLYDGTLHAILDERFVLSEGNIENWLDVFESWGAVPQDLWKPKIPLEEDEVIMMRTLMHLGAYAEKVRQELLQMGLLDENVMDQASPEFSRLFYRIEREYAEGIWEILEGAFGPFPHRFRGKKGAWMDAVSMKSHPVWKGATKKEYFPKVERREGGYAERIARFIDRYRVPVAVTIDWVDPLEDKRTGLLSLEAFGLSPTPSPAERRRLLASLARHRGAEYSHAILIGDYLRDPKTGKVTYFLALNSYGLEYGDQGYNHISAEYFEEFVNEVLLVKP